MMRRTNESDDASDERVYVADAAKRYDVEHFVWRQFPPDQLAYKNLRHS